MGKFSSVGLSMLGVVVLIIMMIGLSACSNESKGNTEADTSKKATAVEEVPEVDMSEPITLKMIEWRGEEQFLKSFKGPVEEKFPNVTLEIIPIQPTKGELEDQFAAGNIPDILMAPDFRYLPIYKETELAYDMTELTDTYNFDLSRFDQNFLDIIRSYSKEEELWGLPFMQNKAALHYNKDIFDLFGVEYPTDDMTYEELLELAKKVTGEMGGTNYTGLVMPSTDRYLFPSLGLNLVDPKTDEPQFTKKPQFQHIFEIYKRVDALQVEDSVHGDSAMDRFISEQNVAMLPMYFLGIDWTGLMQEDGQGINWDIVTFPKWEEQGDVSAFADGYWLGVSAYSEHKEQVFKVIEFLLSDEEVIRKIRYPEESIYIDDEFLEKSDHIRNPLLDDKNMEALYKYPAPPASDGISIYEEIAKSVVSEKLGEYLSTSMDVVTFLRELQEETEIRIQDAKSQE